MRVSATRWCSIRRPCRPHAAVPRPSPCLPSARWSRCRLSTASRRRAWRPSIRRAPRCRRTTSGCTSSSPPRWGSEAATRTSGCSTSAASRLPTHFCRWTSTCGTRIARATRFSTTRGGSSAASGRTPSWAARCQPHRRYTLAIDAAWRDAAGQPLVAPFRREFRVGPPRERALDPAAWRLDLPAGGTRDSLAVRFPVPLDYGLLQSTLRVRTGEGRPLAGEIRVEQGETRWAFAPHAPWRPGAYRSRRGGNPRGCRRQPHRAAVRGRLRPGREGSEARPGRRGAVPDRRCERRAVSERLPDEVLLDHAHP